MRRRAAVSYPVTFRPSDVAGLPERFRIDVLSEKTGITRCAIRYWIRASGLPAHRPLEPGRGNHRYEIYLDEFIAWAKRVGRWIESDAQVIKPGEVERAK